MFQIGQTVVHPGEGLCEITDIRTEEFVKGQPREYYLLRPLGEGGGMTVYLPVDQQRVVLRLQMTPAEARSLRADAEAIDPILTDNDRERQERIARVLRDALPVPLMRLVLELRAEQAQRREHGKKLRFTDEKALQDATRLLRQELSAIPDLTPAERTV